MQAGRILRLPPLCFVSLVALFTLAAKDAKLDAGMLKVLSKSPSVPLWLDRTYDIALFMALVWYGWGWSAALWAGQFMLVPFVRSCGESVRKRANSPQACPLTAPAGVPLSSN
jgi:hypothetical protein